MRKLAGVILAVCLTLAGCGQTVQIAFPFALSDVAQVEMLRYTVPTDAEKKVVTGQEDIADLYERLQSISLKDRDTEPVAGGTTTSFRFHLRDGTIYEVVYLSIAVKAGRMRVTGSQQDYFTAADVGALWDDYDYAVENGADPSQETVEFHGQTFRKSALSEETLQWLARYNQLSPEEQLAISAIPAELYPYDGTGAVDAAVGE